MTQKDARKIMGNNFIGIDEVATYLRISISKKSRSLLQEVPYSKLTLQELKESHILFPGIPENHYGKPITIVNIRNLIGANSDIQPCFYPQHWYDDEIFAKNKTCSLRWYLIRKSIIENSSDKTYGVQETMLADNEERASAVEVVYLTILNYYCNGSLRLFESEKVWCHDGTHDYTKVWVGRFNRVGLVIGAHNPKQLNTGIGIISSRRPDFCIGLSPE